MLFTQYLPGSGTVILNWHFHFWYYKKFKMYLESINKSINKKFKMYLNILHLLVGLDVTAFS